MANSLPQISDCCAPSCESTNVAIPGATGATGAAGADGADGVSAFTTLTSAFVMPAASANVIIAVEDTSWMAVGEPIFIQNAGTFEVITINSATSVTVQNLGYSENAAAGAAIANGSKVTPSGWKGADGAAGSPANSPMTTKGDLWTRNSSTDVRLAVGANGTRLMADSAQASGLRYAKVSLDDTNQVANALPIANGGTGQTAKQAAFDALSPVTTRGDLIVRDAANNVRKALGAQYTVLQSDGTDPQYALIGVTSLDTQVGRAPVDYILLREEQTAGTEGGAFNSGAWRTRALNQEMVDTGNHVALAASQFTLAAGTYRYRAVAMGYECDSHVARLFNVSDATTIMVGTAARSAAAADCNTVSEVIGRFTIASSKTFELQHQCQTTKATSGLGKAANLGVAEVYSFIEIWREAK